jgi:Tfp pilus assembly protein PilO
VTRGLSLASPILAIVVSLLVVVFVVWPKFSQVLRMRVANEELVTRANALSQKAQTLQSLEKDILQTQLVASEQLLPSDKGVFTLVSQIEQAATASAIVLSRVDVTPGNLSPTDTGKPEAQSSAAPAPSTTGEEVANALSLQVKISTSSDYKSFLQFLSNLFAASRVVTVNDLGMSSASSDNQIKVALTVEAYWQALPGQLPSIEAPLVELTESELARLEQVSKTGLVSAPQTSPQVPLGRSDLFAPFE